MKKADDLENGSIKAGIQKNEEDFFQTFLILERDNGKDPLIIESGFIYQSIEMAEEHLDILMSQTLTKCNENGVGLQIVKKHGEIVH